VFGLSAWELREHSLEWLQDVSQTVVRRRQSDKADALTFAVLAAAVGAGSEEAASEVERLMNELVPAEEDASRSHLLNPDAQTDWGAVRNGGLATMAVQRVKVSPDPEGTT